jgi:hypothetical protein
MTMDQAQWVAGMVGVVLGGYGLVGLVFALAFVARGAARLDPAAHGMPLPARLLLIPGAALLWPLMLTKWLRRRTPRTARGRTSAFLRWHLWAWGLVTPALAALLVLALLDRPVVPTTQALPLWLVQPVKAGH